MKITMKELNNNWGVTTEPVRQEIEQLLTDFEAEVKLLAEKGTWSVLMTENKYRNRLAELISLGAVNEQLLNEVNSRMAEIRSLALKT